MARVLSRQVAAVAWRTFSQEACLAEFAAASSVPVINALTDEFHPCQVLADLQTIQESAGQLRGVTLTFLGDGGSNMAHSYLLGGATAGMRVPSAVRRRTQAPAILARAQAIAARTGGSAAFGADPDEGAPARTSWPPTCGRRWGRSRTGPGRSPWSRSGWTRPGWLRPHPAPGCCTACPTAAWRSPARSWTARPAWPGTRPRTGCTRRRRCAWLTGRAA